MSKDRVNFKSNRYAINVPRPAPVNGKGTATKKTKARHSYLWIFLSVLLLIFVKTLSIAFLKILNLLKIFSILFKNNKPNGTRNIFPAIAYGKAFHQTQPNWLIAIIGMVNLDSNPGIIEKIKICSHWGNWSIKEIYSPKYMINNDLTYM